MLLYIFCLTVNPNFIRSISNFTTLGGKHSKVQTSTSSGIETASGLDTRKSKHPDWKQKTVYLPADLAKWLNIHAAQTEMEVSDIVALALRESREKYK